MSRFNKTHYVPWLTFHVFLLIFWGFAACSKYDRENWVNPDDMLNYDRATKTMVNEETSQPQKDGHQECFAMSKKNEEHIKVLQAKVKKCEAAVNNVGSGPSIPVSQSKPASTVTGNQCKKTNSKNVEAMERQYMKRFVNILLQVSGMVDVRLEAGKSKRSSISIDVSSEHLTMLQQFGTGGADVSLGELDDVLSHVLLSSDPGFYVPLGWLERFSHFFSSKDALYRLLPSCITLVTLLMLVFRRHTAEIVVTFLVLVMALGYQWTYDYMLKMAEIKQYIELKRLEEIPASCRPSVGWSLFEYVKSRFTYDERECERYYHAQMMEPALEVTPTVVLSEMVSSMLLHPAEKLGESVARFSGAILGGLPMFQNWIVLVLSLVVIAAVVVSAVVLFCGGRLRLPFYLGGIELSGHSAPRVPLAVQRLPVQEVTPPAASDPLVSALSSSDGLVLMNMPVLERLMSARNERAPHRDFVEQLAPTQTTARSLGDAGEKRDVGGGSSIRKKESRRSDKKRTAELQRDPMAAGDVRFSSREGKCDTESQLVFPREEARISKEAPVMQSATELPRDPMAAGDSARFSICEGKCDTESKLLFPQEEARISKEAPVTRSATELPQDKIAAGDARFSSYEGKEKGDTESTLLLPLEEARISKESMVTRSATELPRDKMASGDSARRVSGDGYGALALVSSCVDLGSRDGGDLVTYRTSLDETLTDDDEVKLKRGSWRSGKSSFIDEIRKILEEDQAASPDTETPPEGRLEMLGAVENLLEECGGASEEPSRKTSTDSSDGSTGFEKL